MFRNPNYKIIFVSGAGVCDLNCSYCYLNHKPSYQEAHAKIMRAWEDGSYAKNIVQTASRVAYAENIETITILGAEPSFGCGAIADSIPTLKAGLPNLSEMFVSTNFASHVENIEKLILASSDNGISLFSLQISLDGLDDEISKNGHNVSQAVYQRNFDHLAEFIGSHDIKFKKMQILIRPTGSIATFIKVFNTQEKISDYFERMRKFYSAIVKQYESLEKNIVVDLRMINTAGPPSVTSEEGLLFADVCKRYQQALDGDTGFSRLLDKMGENRPNTNKILTKFDSFMNTGKWYAKGVTLTCPYETCGYINRITILPDGSVSPCEDWIIQMEDRAVEELKQENYFEYIGQSMMKTDVWDVPNMTDKEFDKAFMKTAFTFEGNFALSRAMYTATAEELARSGQIMKKYAYQPEKVTAECYGQNWTHCNFRNLLMTHTTWLGDAGIFRGYLNGQGAHDVEWLTIDKKLEWKI